MIDIFENICTYYNLCGKIKWEKERVSEEGEQELVYIEVTGACYIYIYRTRSVQCVMFLLRLMRNMRIAENLELKGHIRKLCWINSIDK